MSKHTPGPWRTDKEIIRGGDDDYIAVIIAGNSSDANACLIAAAPELLEACKGFLEHWPFPNGIPLQETANRARAAIAKAEGR